MITIFNCRSVISALSKKLMSENCTFCIYYFATFIFTSNNLKWYCKRLAHTAEPLCKFVSFQVKSCIRSKLCVYKDGWTTPRLRMIGLYLFFWLQLLRWFIESHITTTGSLELGGRNSRIPELLTILE